MIGSLACLGGCSGSSTDKADSPQTGQGDRIGAERPQVATDPKDAAECIRAKQAAVTARTAYDEDYQRRNPGSESASLSIGELTSCKLSASGAFVGKWGGTRWRFVPKISGKYVTDPKKVWVGENEGLDDLSWFLEWRTDGTSVAKNEQLNRDITAARSIEG